ncbi:MAG: menaquinone biosynthesis protein [Candidatus Omnitrophica bacterium]|nr:menaquinone biosynthesis protein [Candidatus Omnitrophota bacterium]
MNIRVGKTPYINAFPFYHGLGDARASLSIDFVEDTPAMLNEKIRSGLLHASLVSSLEYARTSKEYYVLPGLSVSAREASQSVGLVWQGALEELAGKDIFFSQASLSSVALLDILLKERFEIFKTRLIPARENEKENIVKKGGPLLVIGDEALHLRSELEMGFYDLSTLWWAWMKKPFCFALWVVRKEYTDANPDVVREFMNQLGRRVEKNISSLHETIQSIVPLNGFSKEYLKQYLQNFDYGLSGDILQGLFLFYERAARLGWTERVNKLEFIPLSRGDY